MDQIDLGRAFKAPFADKDWVTKSLLAIVWYFLMVTAPVIFGAQLEYIRRVSQGDESLPDWSNFGDKWVKGLLMFVAIFIFTAPLWLLMIVFIVPAIIAGSSGGDDALGVAIAGGMCLYWVFVMIYSVALWLYVLAATTNYAIKGNFGAFFEFKANWQRMRSGSAYWVALLYSLVVSLAFGAVVSLLEITVIGIILVPAAMYLQVMATAHILGQWARQAYASAAPAAPAPPPAPPAPGQ
jgi:hypothetical protein